jgi:16S rRNA (guanine1207-N2)-methyltransferase
MDMMILSVPVKMHHMHLIEENNGLSLFLGNFPGFEVRFYSKPGIPNWNSITPAQTLIIENAVLGRCRRVYILGCGHGAHILALAVIFPQTHFIITDTNGIALHTLQKTLAHNSRGNISISFELSQVQQNREAFDCVIIDMPKGRKLFRRWLFEAYLTLKDDGFLLVAGANDQGIQSAAVDAEDLFTHHSVLTYKKGNRLLQFMGKKSQSSPAGWTNSQGISPGTWIGMQFSFQGQSFQLKTLPGVFASEGIDPGTNFLLEHLQIPDRGRILDFGCGCGVIGGIIARNTNACVDLIDINLYALASAYENIKDLELGHCTVSFSDGLESVQDYRYDLIVSNPPFHSGKAVDYTMTHSFISKSRQVLTKGGILCLVANKFIPYDRILREVYPVLEVPISNQKYSIWKAQKP